MKKLRSARALALGLAGVSAAALPNLAFAQSTPTLQQTFTQVVTSQIIQPTAAPTTITAGNLTVTIPTGALGSAPATFKVLEGTVTGMTPDGTTAVGDFAFQVTDNTTGAAITQFAQPITAALTSPAISSTTEYWNVSPSGGLSLNPVAPTISGNTLTHKITADAVGWVVANPIAGTDFTQHGFPTVSATTAFTPGTAATVSANGISVSIPATAFNIPVTVELLQGPAQAFQSALPSGQSFVADFALKVINPATQGLITTFDAPVVARIPASQINQKSEYLNVLATGAIAANPIAPSISGDILTHAIKADAVGWVITSPSVAGATAPVTGLPLGPVMASGAVLVAAGLVLLRRRPAAERR